MARQQGNSGIRASTLYILLSNVFASMLLVFFASHKADDNWFRIFVMFYLVGMQIFFVVMLYVARRTEKQFGGKPNTEQDAQQTGHANEISRLGFEIAVTSEGLT